MALISRATTLGTHLFVSIIIGDDAALVRRCEICKWGEGVVPGPFSLGGEARSAILSETTRATRRSRVVGHCSPTVLRQGVVWGDFIWGCGRCTGLDAALRAYPMQLVKMAL